MKITRQIELKAGQISDHVSISAETKRTFDWLFHTDVALTCNGVRLSSVQGTLFNDGSASCIRLISQGSCADTLQVIFERDGQKYRLSLSSPHLMDIYLARSPKRGGINMGERHTLIARVRSRQADFFATYEMI